MSKRSKRERARARTQRRAQARAERRYGAASSPRPASNPAEPIRGGERFAIGLDRRWYVARLAPRMMDKALRALRNDEVEVFQPRATRVTSVRGRRVVRSTQMLLRRVFVGVRDETHLETVRGIAGVTEIVSRPVIDPTAVGNVEGVLNEPVRLDPHALQRFVDAVTGDEIVQPFGVGVGQSVIVRQGPFASFPGVVEEILSNERFRIGVAIFGRSTPIELGIAQFEAVT